MANGWESVVAEVLALQSRDGDWKPGPALQWFPKQWLGDDVVMMMSLPARGYHHHLIMMAWQQSPPCSLPDDQFSLRGWCAHPADWGDVWAQVNRAWRLLDGRWWQLGLCRAYLDQMRLRSVRREQGQKGGRPRLSSEQANENPLPPRSKAIAYSGKARGSQRTSSSSASASSSLREDSEGIAARPAGPPQPEVPPVLTFPCIGQNGDPREWGLTGVYLAELAEGFTGMDVLAEARHALAWVKANRPKTAKGMPAFLVNWLTRAAKDSPGRASRQPSLLPARRGGNDESSKTTITTPKGWNP